MTFPAIKPTTREYVPPPYPFVVLTTMNNATTRNLLASKPGQAQLSLSYENISDTIANSFVAFYDTCKGSATSFSLPTELLSGLGEDCASYVRAADTALSWRWDQPPKIDFVKAGICSVSVSLKAYIAPGFLVAPEPAPVVPYNPAIVTDNTIYPSFTGVGVIPPTPPTAVPGVKWVAYTSVNESAINTNSVILSDDGATYTFMANPEHSEVTKFSAVGSVLWTRRFTSQTGQASWSTHGFSGIKVSQSIHRINNNKFICCIVELMPSGSEQTCIIGLTGDGNVLYNKANPISNSLFRIVSPDGEKFITSSFDGYINIYSTSTGSLERRFAFMLANGIVSSVIRSAIQKPNGNWVLSLAVDQSRLFIEIDSSMLNVIRSISILDTSISSAICYRPDTGGYLVLGGSNGEVYHLDESFQIIETRRFVGWPNSIQYDGDGNYYIWTNYTNWYQDIGIPGWPSIITLIKYNWNTNYVHYVTMTNTHLASVTNLNSNLDRMSFAHNPIGLGGGGDIAPAYRLVYSFDLVQPSALNGSPLTTANPPNYTFLTRTVVAPTPRPVFDTIISTRIVADVSIQEMLVPVESTSTFTIESNYRDFTTITYPS